MAAGQSRDPPAATLVGRDEAIEARRLWGRTTDRDRATQGDQIRDVLDEKGAGPEAAVELQVGEGSREHRPLRQADRGVQSARDDGGQTRLGHDVESPLDAASSSNIVSAGPNPVIVTPVRSKPHRR